MMHSENTKRFLAIPTSKLGRRPIRQRRLQQSDRVLPGERAEYAVDDAVASNAASAAGPG